LHGQDKKTRGYFYPKLYFFFRTPLARGQQIHFMKTLLLVGAAAVAAVLIAVSPVLAQIRGHFRGTAQSMNG
jgi:hypothetical protein